MTAWLAVLSAPKKIAVPKIPAFIPTHEVFHIVAEGRAHLVLHHEERNTQAILHYDPEGWILTGPWNTSTTFDPPTRILTNDDVIEFGEWRLRFTHDDELVDWMFGKDWHMFVPLRAAPHPVWRARHRVTRAFAEATMCNDDEEAEHEAHLLEGLTPHPAVPALIDASDAAILREPSMGMSLHDVVTTTRAQGARIDAQLAMHIIAVVADACAAGATVPALVTPSTIVLGWDGAIFFTGFGRTPMTRGPRTTGHYVHARDPADWSARTGRVATHALGVVAWELLHGRSYTGRARTRTVVWPPADELVKDAIGRRIEVTDVARRAKALATDVNEAFVAATVRALFPEAWRAEEALRDEP